MKKILLLILTLGLVGLMTIDCSKMVNITTEINFITDKENPSTAGWSGNNDFDLLNPSVSYSFKSRVLKISIKVQSLTNSMPSSVIACSNGTNYTMGIDYESTTTGLDIRLGITYVKYIVGPAEGEYTIHYYAFNGTASIDDGNSTVYVSKQPFNIVSQNHINLARNVYEFNINIDRYTCATPLIVKIKIDGTEETMVYNATRDLYLFIKDFGNDDSAIHNFTYIVSSDNIKQEISDTLSTGVIQKISFIYGGIINSTINDTKKTVQFYAMYYSWDGLEAKNLQLNINGSATALPVQKWLPYLAYKSDLQNYRYIPDSASSDGIIYGPFNYTILSGIHYIIEIKSKNSTDGESSYTLMNGTDYFGYDRGFDFAVKIASTGTKYNQYTINLTVLVTNAKTNVLTIPFSLTVHIFSPTYGAKSDYLFQIDGTNWSAGITYQRLLYISSILAPYYGDIVMRFELEDVDYNIDGIIANDLDWVSSKNYTLTGTPGAIGKYKVSSEDWNIWDVSNKEMSCGCDSSNVTTRTLIKIMKMGRLLNADVFLTTKYQYNYDYKLWYNVKDFTTTYISETDYWNLNNCEFQFQDPNSYLTLYGWHPQEGLITRYYLPTTVDIVKMKDYFTSNLGYSKVSLSGRRISLDFSVPGYKNIRSFEYDYRNVLKNIILNYSTDCYSKIISWKWINRGHGALPKNDGTPLIDGYEWFLLLGLAITSIGIISIIHRKKGSSNIIFYQKTGEN